MAAPAGLTQRVTQNKSSTPVQKGQADGPPKAVVPSAPYAAAWTKPKFTLSDVQKAIPSHCFKRNTLRSFGYVFHDYALVITAFLLATQIYRLPGYLQYPAWLAYWIAQGIFFTGIWIVAHECGHQAFSDKAWINNSVGFVLHTFVLTPYYSWKISHSKHHKNNAHLTKDMVFVPHLRSERAHLPPKDSSTEEHHDEPVWKEAPIVDVWNIFAMLTFGWPLYLIKNVSGQAYGSWVSHFRPNSVIYEPKQWFQVIISDLGLLAMIAILFVWGQAYGSLSPIMYYLVPYIEVNAWLVLITFLQHTDVKIPHYRDGDWSFLLGALSTVDRDFGILNHFFHHISDTHVLHHIMSTIPHYHAEEATEAMKKVLGGYYIMDKTSIAKSLWRSYRDCKFVEDQGGVVWYKN